MNDQTDFFVLGGTLSQNALSYVFREADSLLYASLLKGEFCYILTSRQMGKSSLMVRAAVRLRELGILVALVDLTTQGQNLNVEQWYKGMLNRIGEQLELEDALDDFWSAQSSVPPMERWFAAIRNVILPQAPCPVILFIDEIDMVRSLPFKTEEFFAGIRACYNHRQHEPALNRLTFCLLGVASPSDLIDDVHITPFNVGTRIELRDFSPEEASSLAVGISLTGRSGDVMLERILYWTGGHPYLTQRLCAAVAAEETALTEQDVDIVCAKLFFSEDALQSESNLTFVSARLLKSDEDLAALLELYKNVWMGRRVLYTETNPFCRVLRLSGVAGERGGKLQVRNRIYARVFDRQWLAAHMPDAEQRRQRAAFQMGMVRTAVAAFVLVALAGVTAFMAYRERVNAVTQRKLTEQARKYNYVADMMLIQRNWEAGQYARVAELLESQLPGPSEQDLRGWEWGHYWRLMHQDLHTSVHQGSGIVSALAYSPDRSTIVSGKQDGSIKLWDANTGREVDALIGDLGMITSLAFSPIQPDILAVGSADKGVALWDIRSRRLVSTFGAHGGVWSVAFTPDGLRLVVGCMDTIQIWDVGSHRPIRSLPRIAPDNARMVAVSPDGKWIASATECGNVEVREQTSLRLKELLGTILHRSASDVYSLAFSPDSRFLVVGRFSGRVEIWNVRSGRLTVARDAHGSAISGLAFSLDGKRLATAGWDDTVGVWDCAHLRLVRRFIGHRDKVTSVAFSPDGIRLASGGGSEIKLWDPRSDHADPELHLSPFGQLAFTRDSKLLMLVNGGNAGTVTIQDVFSRRIVSTIKVAYNASATLSRDGRLIGLGSQDGTVHVVEVGSGRVVALLNVDARSTAHSIGWMAFSPNSSCLAISSGDPAHVSVWDIGTRHEIVHFDHPNTAQGIAFAPLGDELATGNWKGDLYLWNLASGQTTTWHANSQPVTSVDFTPDGRTVASASEGGTITLWNRTTLREMITLREPGNIIDQILFSPDGRQLVSLGSDRKIRVYHAESQVSSDLAVPSVGR